MPPHVYNLEAQDGFSSCVVSHLGSEASSSLGLCLGCLNNINEFLIGNVRSDS